MDGTGAVPTKQKTSASSYASSCPSYHRIVSYVQQGDVHSPLLTVRETLLFAARCQFPENDAERIHARVDVVLQVNRERERERETSRFICASAFAFALSSYSAPLLASSLLLLSHFSSHPPPLSLPLSSASLLVLSL